MSSHLSSRLKWARESSGLTQQWVAGQIGLGDTSISEWESGSRPPSISQLNKLAGVYHRSLDFFLQDEPAPSGEAVALWRFKPATSKAKQLEAQFRELAEQYYALENLCDDVRRDALPESEKIPGERFGYPHAEALAEKVQRDLDLGEYPGDGLLDALEERLGVKVFFVDFGESGSAACMRSEAWGSAIFLHNDHALYRRRSFDLAHELFHLITWRDFGHDEGGRLDENPMEEKLANAFAARLLMPGAAFKTTCLGVQGEKGWTHEQLLALCRLFRVSPDALLWRMKDCGLIGLDKGGIQAAADAMRSLAKLIEPKEETGPLPLRPARYEALARRALMHGTLSVSAFARYMGITRHEASKIAEEQEAQHVEEAFVAAA